MDKITDVHLKPPSNKNTLLLQLSAEYAAHHLLYMIACCNGRYVWLAGGGLCFMCKSGKDRTGMAVTLEEGRHLVTLCWKLVVTLNLSLLLSMSQSFICQWVSHSEII